MKKFLLFVLLLSNSSLFSQNLSLNEIFAICNKSNWDEVNEILIRKGWEYHESKRGDKDYYSTITWSFNKERYSDKANAWLHLYTYEGLPNKIAYLFFNKTSYNSIRSSIANTGMKLIDDSIEDNELVTKYTGGNFTVTIKTTKRENDNKYTNETSFTSYSILVIKKSGVYDLDNGKKTEYYDNDQIKAEYLLLNGKLNGQLKVYHENGKLQKVGNYTNGKESGKFIEYDEDGIKTAEYTMVNGTVNGVITFYNHGLKSQESTEENGIRNGKHKEYYYDEENKLYLRIEGNYLADKQNGLWQTYLISDGKEEVISFTNYTDGIKNGPFMEYVKSDTIETGTYKNGILDGYFKRETKKIGYLQKDFTKVYLWSLECEGSYTDGLESGKWIYYDQGNKKQEGNYDKGKKTGKWLNYITVGNHSGEIRNETTYLNGKENGIFMQYFETNLSSPFLNENEFISFNFNNYPVQESFYYKDGVKDGEYVLKDSLDNLISKGNYSNDKKEGQWIESSVGEEIDGKPSYIYQKGNYKDGQKNGLWEINGLEGYINANYVYATYNYVKGKLNGSAVLYNSINKPIIEKYFENDNLKIQHKYDSLGVSIIRTFEILKNSPNELICRKTEINEKGKVSQEYILEIGDDEKIDYDSFEYIFYEKTELDSNLTGYPKGEFKKYDDKNKILIEGSYYKNLKTGKWRHYYYDQNIFIEQLFYENNGGVEKFYEINTNQFFSGKHIEKYENGKLKYEFKISDGLRDGKSKYFDENGKIIKTVKYEKGIIQN